MEFIIMPQKREDVVIWCENGADSGSPVCRAASVSIDVMTNSVALQVLHGPIVAIVLNDDGTFTIQIHDHNTKAKIERTNYGGVNEVQTLWPVQ